MTPPTADEQATAWAAVRAALVDVGGLHLLVDQLDPDEARDLAAVLAMVVAQLMARQFPPGRLPDQIGEHLRDLARDRDH